MMSNRRILWVDDEIDLLRAHVKLLEQKGYSIETAANGEDAVEMVKSNSYDLVLLDEMMPGIGGLKTLAEIKAIEPSLPVVMITKNEAESLMEEAIGSKITDYLLKPINPSQVLMACKKILEGKKIAREYVSRDYVQEFQTISRELFNPLDEHGWTDLYVKLTNWDLELDDHPELGFRQTLLDQKREVNSEFAKYIEKNYRRWLTADPDRRPALSTDIVRKYVVPELRQKKSVFLFVIDCLRLDQWIMMERMLADAFSIDREYYYSILPTATPYSRNAIFSGLFPLDLERRFPEIWKSGQDDENSRNRHEQELLSDLLNRSQIDMKLTPKYLKILDPEFGKQIESNIISYVQSKMTAIVVNFIDMLAHGRSDSPLLKEIAPDEAAFRSLTQAWFQHSSFYGMLKTLSQQKNVVIFVTTDHGSVRCMRGSKVIGDREASTSLRYKYGRNLRVNDKEAVYIREPEDFKLPRGSVTTTYVLAKEDYYFVYPTEYHKYLNQYRDSFQHGGISMEEMILPIARLEPKR